MTSGRWGGLAAYLCITFGGSLVGHGLAHDWQSFPVDAGINLMVAGFLLLAWITFKKRKGN